MKEIAVVGTESFWDGWDGDSSTKLNNIDEWCEDEWNEHIEDGSGDYDAYFNDYSRSSVEIPNSALSGCTLTGGGVECAPLYERREDAQTWLNNNWRSYSDADVVLVADYYGGDDGAHGYAGGLAGNDVGKTCIIDTYWEDSDNGAYTSGGFLERVGVEGVGFHEVGHTYCADHKHGIVFSDDTATMMNDFGNSPQCGDYGDPDTMVPEVAVCARDRIRCYFKKRDNCSSC